MRGTDQPCRTNLNEMQYEQLTKVAVPKVLNTLRARKIFKERSAELIAKGLLQKPDVDLLTAYANAYDLWMQAVEAQGSEDLMTIVKTKSGTMTMPSPYIKLQQELINQIKAIGMLFGFSPTSRASMKMEAPKQQDEFDVFLNSKR